MKGTKIIYDSFEWNACIAYEDGTGEPYHALKNPTTYGHIGPIHDSNTIPDELTPFVFYSVYGYIPDQGVECIADFYNREEAIIIIDKVLSLW